MRKHFLLLVLFLFLIFPLISAVEVEIKSNFSSGENLLAKFSGNFVDQITEDAVFFYRGHVKIPMTYNVVKINDEFYVSAILTGKTEGNYSISIEGIRYMKATEVVDDPIVSNFTISNETAEFSINPGILITDNDFSVEIQNLQDRKITVEVTENSPMLSSQPTLDLKSGEKKTLSFNVIDNAEKGLVDIKFSSGNFSYSFPVYLDTNVTGTKNESFSFQPSIVEVQMATGSISKRILYLTNTGSDPIKDITLNISSLLAPYISVSPKNIDTLNPGSNEKIEIQITSGSQEVTLEGKIFANTENISSSFTLVLDFIKDFIPSENITTVTTCSDLGGSICDENFKCSGDSVYAKDGVCCQAPATCEEVKKSSTGKLIGWGLLLFALLFLYWFYKRRYRRVMPRRAF